jgi:PIN domain nuclease of toxin-antitoxin system
MLLDTHAFIWLSFGDPMKERAVEVTGRAAADGALVLSAITVWEVGNLVRRRRIELYSPTSVWLAKATAARGIRVVPLDAEIALAATELPGEFHRDPADRFLVATARALDVPIVTRDAAILAYADAGYVRALPC